MRNTTPKFALLREKATAEDMVAHGDRFVSHVPERYEWDEDALYEALVATDRENRARIENDQPTVASEADGIAKIEFGQHVQFFAAKVEPVRKAKKGKP
jgi:hypothetical protein